MIGFSSRVLCKIARKQTSYKGCLPYLIPVLFLIITPDTNLLAQTFPPGGPLKWFKKADSLYKLDDIDETLENHALDLYIAVATSSNKNLSKALIVESFIKAGNIYQGWARFQEANNLYHRALTNISESDKLPVLIYEAYLYLGSSMYSSGIMDSAKFYFEKTAELSVAYRNSYELPDQERLYNSLGAIYYESADYKQAKKFFETALELASPRQMDFNTYETTISINIARCLLKLRNFNASILLLSNLQPNQDQKLLVQRNLANAYFEKGDYDSALSIYLTYKFPEGSLKRLALNDLGQIYMEKGMLRESKTAFDSAILISKVLGYSVKNKEDAIVFLNLGKLAQKQDFFREALLWCNMAVNKVHLSFKPTSLLDLPDDVSNTVSPITFFQILVYKADILYQLYLKDKNQKYLIAALQTYVTAFETANFISVNFDNDDAKLFLIENSKSYYGQAVQIAYEAVGIDEKHYQQLVFILESYKGNILRQNLEYTKLKQNAGLPNDIIQRENQLKQLYAVYLTKLNMATSEKESTQFQKKLSEIKLELSTIRKLYEKNQLFSWIGKSMDNNIPINLLQKGIDNQTALINYFVSKKDIYILLITSNKIKVEKVKITPQFKEAFTKYLQETLSLNEGKRYEGYAASHVLFNALFKPIYPLIHRLKNFIIIPDNYLYNLPFDALIKTKDSKDFLIYSHAISFHYSFALLLRNTPEIIPPHRRRDSIIALAPFAKESINGIYNAPLLLPFSGQEVNNPKTAIYLNDKATKNAFLKHYHNYGIIHFATHASLGKDSSSNWIQFFPNDNVNISDRMYVHEIYNLHMAANELVILSACESGAGLSAEGEGLLSLSRAFIYAGSGGIISTLYKTDDRVTAFLMERFYHHLNGGEDARTAMQKSKLDLLSSDELNARVKSPNYWSNFVYIGKIKPNHAKSYQSLWLLLLLILVIFLAIKKLKGIRHKN
jgi:CHAT domain-containing protein